MNASVRPCQWAAKLLLLQYTVPTVLYVPEILVKARHGVVSPPRSRRVNNQDVFYCPCHRQVFPCSLSRGAHPASGGLFSNFGTPTNQVSTVQYVQKPEPRGAALAPGLTLSPCYPHPRLLSRSSTVLGPGLDSLTYQSNSDAQWHMSTRTGTPKCLEEANVQRTHDQVVDTKDLQCYP